MNNSNNFLIFSHEQDVDGLFSAAVLRMVYPGSQVILTNYGFQNMLAVKDKILSFIQSFDSGTIIISDIELTTKVTFLSMKRLALQSKEAFQTYG